MTFRDRDLSWHEYICRRRVTMIERYRTAHLRPIREDARMWALHYGRLLRKASASIIGVTK